MEALVRRIEERLNNYKVCRVFEHEIERVWPLEAEERKCRERRSQQIKEFAEAHGWEARVYNPPIQVVFRNKV